jgi:hypothetical protein
MTNDYNKHEPDYSVIPPTGSLRDDSTKKTFWPSRLNLPQGPSGNFSMAGWTEDNEGFIQQTFLGASIRSFNVTGGFGGSTSNLSVELVEDEYNVSDSTFLGVGDDVYHSGNGDKFIPPPVGTPVFFKFGKNWATVEQAFRRSVDEAYNITFKDTKGRGIDLKKWDQKEFKKIEETGNFSEFPFEESGKMPNERQKFYLRDREKNDVDNPYDDTRTFIDKSFTFTHDDESRGYYHFAFGGILQSVVESKSMAGNPMYTAQVSDPRDILSNCSIILNDYAGTTFNNKNLFNVYGFLEYDPSKELQDRLDTENQFKWILEKNVDSVGVVSYIGHDRGKPITYYDDVNEENGQTTRVNINPSFNNLDLYRFPPTILSNKTFSEAAIDYNFSGSEVYPRYFPITGEGYSRRSDKGIPWYRVSQGLAALFEQYGQLPREYRNAGFGGTINFRGFNYVVDFGGIPLEKIPKSYFLDYNQIDLLSLVLELCEAISHDLFVSLLPVIDPLTEIGDEVEKKGAIMNSAFARNNYWLKKASEFSPEDPSYQEYISNIIHGVIRLDAIDKSRPPRQGAIKDYIDNLGKQGVYVQNRDLGFELSNVTTDKFVTGAQEVDMYYFSTHRDRDTLEYRKKIAGVPNYHNAVSSQQWTLEASLKQQVLPFYGFLGKKALSIPRGFGSFQQIMLDTSALDAHGVGNYYIATEMELRAAAVSYQNWVKFLLQYNDVYIEEVSENKTLLNELAKVTAEEVDGLNDLGDEEGGISLRKLKNRDFAVTVPRCVFNSERDFMGPDGYPASPCNPPYGYPLYYKRAEKIGIPQAGAAQVANSLTRVITELDRLEEFAATDGSSQLTVRRKKIDEYIESLNNRVQNVAGNPPPTTSHGSRTSMFTTDPEQQGSYHDPDENGELQESRSAVQKCLTEELRKLEKTIKTYKENGKNISQIENVLESKQVLIKNLNKLSRRSEKNAQKIHAFLKQVAEENLGKKFLVKIPKHTNPHYSEKIKLAANYVSIDGGEANSMNQQIGEYQNNPFGFRPRPISTNVNGNGILTSPDFIQALEMVRNSYRVIHSWDYERFLYKEAGDLSYDYGALKGNYNPMEEKWAFNYRPETQGGYFNFALYSRNLSLSEMERNSESIIGTKNTPLGVEQHLIPKDLVNFVSDNGRISCYVRYDNSQYLDFTGVDKNSFTQEVAANNSIYVADILEDLDNVNPDLPSTKDRINDRISGKDSRPKSIAFVKCSVDEELYMPPKSKPASNLVLGRKFNFELNFDNFEVIETTDASGCPKFTCVRPYAQPIFTLPTGHTTTALAAGTEYINPQALSQYNLDMATKTFSSQEVLLTYGRPERKIGGGGSDGTVVKTLEHVRRFHKSDNPYYDSFLIDTEEKNLDSDHVYALVTVPGRVKPTEDQRYIDTHKFSINPTKLKHILTQDVVRGAVGFEKPSPIINRKVPIDCKHFNYTQVEGAIKANKANLWAASLAVPEIALAYGQDSPVYPTIFAIPLMSTERCYGPWLSASNITNLPNDRDRYTDIGGKVEFVKDENLAPWNYAGYQLMNEAGMLKAEFSNSLMLFSERGGFVFPSVPSGISLGKSLGDAGPLVTSMSINVSEAGVSTTVKMDLYTARFGKLQKQREQAIDQIARERQKLLDSNNKMIRQGVMNMSKSLNVGGAIKSAGGDIIRLAESFTDLERGRPSLDSVVFSVNQQTQEFESIEDGTNVTVEKQYTQASVQSSDQTQESMSSVDDLNEARIANINSAGGSLTDIFVPYSSSYHRYMPYTSYMDYDSRMRAAGRKIK